MNTAMRIGGLALTVGVGALSILSGCAGDVPGGPDGGRPPQDPIVPDPTDEDPCYGLDGEDLAECLAEEDLLPSYGLDFEATGHSYNGGAASEWSGSSYTISRQSAYIPCSDVPDYMQHLVSANTVCFRATARWASRPPEDVFPAPELPSNTVANASVTLRESGASLCETRYEAQYDGYNQYGYEIPETASNPEVLNFCSDELASYDGEIGFIHAVTGIYDASGALIHLDWPNTVSGDTPPDLENPSALSAIALYSETGQPAFSEDEEGQLTGIIGNEGLFIRPANESIMTFNIGAGFSSDSVSLGSGEDLDGNTVSSLSAILYSVDD